MEKIRKYDRKAGELIMDDHQEEIYLDVEELKSAHTIGGLRVCLAVQLFYGAEPTDDPQASGVIKTKGGYYLLPTGTSEPEKDFDSYVINNLDFKWLINYKPTNGLMLILNLS